MPFRTLKLRRPDVCAVCGKDLQAGETGWWDPAAKTVMCPDCHGLAAAGADVHGSAMPDRGTAGASAGREHERRRTKRETRVRNAHPHIGGLLLWLTDEPQHQRAFKTGQLGEVAVSESLEKRTAEGPAVILHDRRMPLGRGNIDHIAVAPMETMACTGPGAMAWSGPTSRRLFVLLMLPDRPVGWHAAAVVAKAEPVGRVPEWR